MIEKNNLMVNLCEKYCRYAHLEDVKYSLTCMSQLLGWSRR